MMSKATIIIEQKNSSSSDHHSDENLTHSPTLHAKKLFSIEKKLIPINTKIFILNQRLPIRNKTINDQVFPGETFLCRKYLFWLANFDINKILLKFRI